jgi:hypothetical protein
MQGLRLVHLHLSLLHDKNYGDILEIKRAVQSISDNSAYLQIFNLSNEDVLILYKGIKFSTITEACQKIEKMMLARTKMTGPNPYKENSLYSIMELSLNFVNVIRFIEGLAEKGGTADGAKASTKEPSNCSPARHVGTGSGSPVRVIRMALRMPMPRRRAVSMTDRTLA